MSYQQCQDCAKFERKRGYAGGRCPLLKGKSLFPDARCSASVVKPGTEDDEQPMVIKAFEAKPVEKPKEPEAMLPPDPQDMWP